MPITAFTGPPGSGKSHALVKDVILPAVNAGRRVLCNIDGINPDAIRTYVEIQREDKGQSPDGIGQVIPFHGEDAQKPGFWPDEETDRAGTETFVKGGDLVVFDEWALYFPASAGWPAGCNVEGFLRWHRHLTGPDGVATDVAIGTQMMTDLHRKIRALVSKSYKFRKLGALGDRGQKRYAWFLYEGHLQRAYYLNGSSDYDPEVFPLYASSSAAKEGTHVELRASAKESIWSGWKAKAVVVGGPLSILLGLTALWHAWGSFAGAETPPAPVEAAGAPPAAAAGQAAPVRTLPTSPWRIIGQVQSDAGVRVILSNDKGAIRMETAENFRFDDGRPIAGVVDGQTTIAQDTAPVYAQQSFDGLFQ